MQPLNTQDYSRAYVPTAAATSTYFTPYGYEPLRDTRYFLLQDEKDHTAGTGVWGPSRLSSLSNKLSLSKNGSAVLSLPAASLMEGRSSEALCPRCEKACMQTRSGTCRMCGDHCEIRFQCKGCRLLFCWREANDHMLSMLQSTKKEAKAALDRAERARTQERENAAREVAQTKQTAADTARQLQQANLKLDEQTRILNLKITEGKKIGEELQQTYKAQNASKAEKEEIHAQLERLKAENAGVLADMKRIKREKFAIAEKLADLEQYSTELTELKSEQQRAAKEALHSNQLGDGKWNTFYDLVIRTARGSCFADLLDVRKGWEVMQVAGFNEEETTRYPIVAVLGDFNRGKSYVLNQLADAELPVGQSIHTEGLSFKMLRDEFFQEIVLCDTAGCNSPVQEVTDYELNQKRLEEEFLRGVAFDVADVFLFVVNHLNAKEQQELWALSRDIQYCKDNPTLPDKHKVIVVHNLKDVRTRAELETHRRAIYDMYSSSTYEQEQTVFWKDTSGKLHEDKVTYLDGRIKTSSTSSNSSTDAYMSCQSHFIIAKEGTEAGVGNAAVFAHIKEKIRAYELTQGKLNLKQRVLECCNRQVKKACVSNNTLQNVELEFVTDFPENIVPKRYLRPKDAVEIAKIDIPVKPTAPPPVNPSAPKPLDGNGAGTKVPVVQFRNAPSPSFIRPAEEPDSLVGEYQDKFCALYEMPGCVWSPTDKTNENRVQISKPQLDPKDNQFFFEIKGLKKTPAFCDPALGSNLQGSRRKMQFHHVLKIPAYYNHEKIEKPTFVDGVLQIQIPRRPAQGIDESNEMTWD
eukprot:TRINITY_DN67936_c1_g1_i1.p1 TRINITY_DN67936_c1_g1~~TRINITY_DN67936_c1_g1_i1.p1  ORF type:complete len:807 (+),score=73.81 TRINITY_DN67936_c1_g1_i1:76-2496(+)